LNRAKGCLRQLRRDLPLHGWGRSSSRPTPTWRCCRRRSGCARSRRLDAIGSTGPRPLLEVLESPNRSRSAEPVLLVQVPALPWGHPRFRWGGGPSIHQVLQDGSHAGEAVTFRKPEQRVPTRLSGRAAEGTQRTQCELRFVLGRSRGYQPTKTRCVLGNLGDVPTMVSRRTDVATLGQGSLALSLPTGNYASVRTGSPSSTVPSPPGVRVMMS
jgi:hypothetical protein